MTDLKRLLDEATPVIVKPLDWSQYNHAQGVAGQYQWQDWKAPGFRAVFFPSGSGSGQMIGDWHPSEDAAKAACQQHHAEQVAALLVPGVAAVNAVPELLALRDEVGRLREIKKAAQDFADLVQPSPSPSASLDYQAAHATRLARLRAALNQEPGE